MPRGIERIAVYGDVGDSRQPVNKLAIQALVVEHGLEEFQLTAGGIATEHSQRVVERRDHVNKLAVVADRDAGRTVE